MSEHSSTEPQVSPGLGSTCTPKAVAVWLPLESAKVEAPSSPAGVKASN